MSLAPQVTSRDGDYPSRLARNLIVARAAIGWTQHQLARRSRISRATIAHIEATESDPRLSTVVLLAQALDVSPLCLLLGETEIESLDGLRGIPLIDDRAADRAAVFGESRATAAAAAIGNAIRPGRGGIASAALTGCRPAVSSSRC
jgi:transcriptional regulator with XRE-family HTH domain